MPNGGVHHCGHCEHYDLDSAKCMLRGAEIESSHWTTCKNFNRPGQTILGPMYAIICEVKNGGATYGDIPYCDGIRVDTHQRPDGGDTFVCFTDASGNYHEFPTVNDYLSYYRQSGREF